MKYCFQSSSVISISYMVDFLKKRMSEYGFQVRHGSIIDSEHHPISICLRHCAPVYELKGRIKTSIQGYIPVGLVFKNTDGKRCLVFHIPFQHILDEISASEFTNVSVKIGDIELIPHIVDPDFLHSKGTLTITMLMKLLINRSK
ncbi:hypothetical protein [Tepidibacillus marianensis]|uniref:hypothetical protein n=1 Tax=Tepidibacillus marianensis TaxID=3131995 RepID=UPI0030D2D5BA